jgi:hypothetical protein
VKATRNKQKVRRLEGQKIRQQRVTRNKQKVRRLEGQKVRRLDSNQEQAEG